MMFIVTALALGFAGGMHCVGMCGPIALALPQPDTSKLNLTFGRLLYNAGRIVTYAALGIVAGFWGQAISFAGFQKGLSIILGISLLFIAFFTSKKTGRFFTAPEGIARRWRKITGAFFRKRSYSAMLIIGILNGFLPCGMVYVALAGAAATGQMQTAVLFMVVFGLGTVPAMLTIALAGKYLSLKLRHSLNRLIPIVTVCLAIILVLRGLSLGIPYLSPDIDEMSAKSAQHRH